MENQKRSASGPRRSSALSKPVPVPNEDREAAILERIATRGPSALSDAELLSLVLPEGSHHRTFDVGRHLLATCGGAVGLLTCDLAMARAQGLDELQACAILSAVELGRRLVATQKGSDPLADPGMVARYLHLRHARVNQEVLGALFLDVHRRVVGDVECFRGIATRVAVEPRPILREAVLRNAAGIVLFHNHPSGDPTPSDEDLRFTARMKDACEAVSLDLLDHLILGGDRWTSIRWIRPHLVSAAAL